MNLRVIIDMQVSPTIAATMQRNGFEVKQDGSAMQVRVPNSPPIPRRMAQVAFIENPSATHESVIDASRLSK